MTKIHGILGIDTDKEPRRHELTVPTKPARTSVALLVGGFMGYERCVAVTRHVEGVRPDIAPSAPGVSLDCNIFMRIPPIGHHSAFSFHPGVEIDAVLRADRDGAP